MKKTILSLLLVMSLIWVSCENPTNSESVIPDFIPELAFGGLSSGRFTVDTSNDDISHKAAYILMAPLLNNFKQNSSKKGGESYSMPVFNSNMVFDIEPQSGSSTFLFKGNMEDGSGWLNVEYIQSSKTFSFEQCLLLEDPNVPVSYVIYAKGSDIQMDNSGNFHDWYEISYVSRAVEDSVVGWEFFTTNAEIYRGVMNSSGQIGTGFAYFSDADDDSSNGVRTYSIEGKPDGSPDSITIDNLSSWYSTLSDSSIGSLDSLNDFTEGFWEIRYHIEGSDSYFRISDDSEDEDLEDNTLDGFKRGFGSDYVGSELTTRADLTTWGNSSLIVGALE